MTKLIRAKDFVQVCVDIDGDEVELMGSERQAIADAANARLAPLAEALDRLGNAYEEAPLSDCQGELEDVLEAFMALKEGK
jgi:hypothetical protein